MRILRSARQRTDEQKKRESEIRLFYSFVSVKKCTRSILIIVMNNL